MTSPSINSSDDDLPRTHGGGPAEKAAEPSTRPMKSILKSRDNTVPLASRSTLLADRRVSFAENFRLHTIEITPLATEEEHSESSSSLESDVDEDTSFLALEADADKVLSALRFGNSHINGQQEEDPEQEGQRSLGSEEPLADRTQPVPMSHVPEWPDSSDLESTEETMDLTAQVKPALAIKPRTQSPHTNSGPDEPQPSPQPNDSQEPRATSTQIDEPEPVIGSPQADPHAEVLHPGPLHSPGHEVTYMSHDSMVSIDSIAHPTDTHGISDSMSMSLTIVHSTTPYSIEDAGTSQDFPSIEESMEFTEQLKYHEPQRLAGHVNGFEHTEQQDELQNLLPPHSTGAPRDQPARQAPFSPSVASDLQDKPQDDVTMDFTEAAVVKPANAIDSDSASDAEEPMDLTQPVQLGLPEDLKQSPRTSESEPKPASDVSYQPLPERQQDDETHQQDLSPDRASTPPTIHTPGGEPDLHQTPQAQTSLPETLESHMPDQRSQFVTPTYQKSPDQSLHPARRQTLNISAASKEISTPSTTEPAANKRALRPALDFNSPKRHQGNDHYMAKYEALTGSGHDHSRESDTWAGPKLSLTEFLQEIGIKFYDDLGIPTSPNIKHSALQLEFKEDCLDEDYYRANIQVPLLELYEISYKELADKIQHGKTLFTELKEKTLQENPALFRIYSKAPFYQQMEMKSKFHLMKEFTRQQAKQVWYEWRTKLIHNILEVYENNLELLKSDEAILKDGLLQLDRQYVATVQGIANVRQDIKRFKEIKNHFQDLGSDQIKSIRLKIATLNNDLTQQKIIILEKRSAIKTLEDQMSETQLVIQTLRESIASAEGELSNKKRFNVREISDLEVVSKIYQACAGLKFVSSPRPSIYHFEFNARLAITVDVDQAGSAEGLVFQPRETGDNVLYNSILLDKYCQHLAEQTKFLDIYETLKSFKLRWNRLLQIDRDIHKLSMMHPVKFDTTSSDYIRFEVRHFTTDNNATTKYHVLIPLASIAQYPQTVSVEAEIVRGEASESKLAAALRRPGSCYEMFIAVQRVHIR